MARTLIDTEDRIERAYLVGVDIGQDDDWQRSMKELVNLTEASGREVAGQVTQKLDKYNKGLYVGTGKAVEVGDEARACGADLIITEASISPMQQRNLSIQAGMPVLDRTGLILQIFSSRAKSHEARLQVESAKLRYDRSRLAGSYGELGKQAGASGAMSNKGSGEKKIELDRRNIDARIAQLERELEDISTDRDTQRAARRASSVPQVSLVGYTNAGKSTIMNAFVATYGVDDTKQVFAQDMLFATLDTSVRKIDDDTSNPFYLTDTVGFIHNLPHGLVKAFGSTLEEALGADLLLEVVDLSDSDYPREMEVTKSTLADLGAGDLPIIHLYNKIDKCDTCEHEAPFYDEEAGIFYMSAKSPECIDALLGIIKSRVYASSKVAEFLIPYSAGAVSSYLCDHAQVLVQEHRPEGTYLKAMCRPEDRSRYAQYVLE